MDNRNIFKGCFNLIKNYDKVFEFENDNFYGAYYAQNENREINPNDPAIQEKWEAHLRSHIKEVFTSAYEHLITAFGNLTVSNKKIEFIEEAFEIIGELQDLSEEQSHEDEFRKLVKSQMSSLYTQIHRNFDEDLFIIKQLEREPKDSEKLQFNLTRTELTHFLLLLKDGDIISDNVSDYALAIFSEKNFVCTRENSTQIPLRSIEKYISKIRSGEQLSESATESLKEMINGLKDTLLKSEIKIN